MKRPVIMIGSGGHARVLISSLVLSSRQILGILDPDPMLVGRSIIGIRVIGNDDVINQYDPEEIELVNGIGSISSTTCRCNVYSKFKMKGYSFTQVIHPSAIVVNDVQVGEGSQIMAGAVIQTGSIIGDNVLVNTGAIIDHDCSIGAHTHVAPGAVLSGGIRVADMVHIGTSATIIQGINIGYGAMVGAGAVVVRDVPQQQKIVGNPGRYLT